MNSQAAAAPVPWAAFNSGQGRNGLMISAVPSAGCLLGVRPSWQPLVSHRLSDHKNYLFLWQAVSSSCLCVKNNRALMRSYLITFSECCCQKMVEPDAAPTQPPSARGGMMEKQLCALSFPLGILAATNSHLKGTSLQASK